jgi:predicted regulator of Ras-like GTPase activity (Roadblock/LC7/MglB family)
LPYLLILERLLRAVAGARAALLLDPNGEVVVDTGAKDLQHQHRLIGAYQGIALATARRALERHAVGRIDQLTCRYALGTVALTALKDDYYLVLALSPEASLGTGLYHSARAREELNAEL